MLLYSIKNRLLRSLFVLKAVIGRTVITDAASQGIEVQLP
jgi:hypothetical protein